MCSYHGPLAEGQKFCEHCSPAAPERGEADLPSSSFAGGVAPVVAPSAARPPATPVAPAGFGIVADSVGRLEFDAGAVQPDRPWVLGVRLPELRGETWVRIRVAGQRRDVHLVDAGERSVQFDGVGSGDHQLHVDVWSHGRSWEGDGRITARAPDGPVPLNIFATGTGSLVSVTGAPQRSSTAWTSCTLRIHSRDSMQLEPRRRSDGIPHLVFLNPPNDGAKFLVRGARNVVGRGAQAQIDLARLSRQPDALSGLSREAAEFTVQSSGCLRMRVTNQLGALMKGCDVRPEQCWDIPLRELQSWIAIEFPGNIGIRVKALPTLAIPGVRHTPWTDHGHAARNAMVGALHVQARIFDERYDLIWVLDAVSVRELGQAVPGSGFIFDQGDALYHAEPLGPGAYGQVRGRMTAFPLEPGMEWELPSGRWKVTHLPNLGTGSKP